MNDHVIHHVRMRDQRCAAKKSGGRPSWLHEALCIGMPDKVLFAVQRAGGRYLAGAFDYGTFVCQFETGIDNIPRFDAHLEVFGECKTLRVQCHTPYVRNLPIRVFTTESNGQGGLTTSDAHPA